MAFQRRLYSTDDFPPGCRDIRKNVAFGVPEEEIDDEKLWYALREAQLDEFIKTLPDGVYRNRERGTGCPVDSASVSVSPVRSIMTGGN